ncbi:hypothetical protein D3C87_1738890 [compost metagenome]
MNRLRLAKSISVVTTRTEPSAERMKDDVMLVGSDDSSHRFSGASVLSQLSPLKLADVATASS